MPPQPLPPPDQTPYAPTEQQPYNFILNPEQPAKKPGLLSNSSMPIKIGIVLGGILILFLLFLGFKSLLGGGNNLKPYTVVAQDQQELIHLTTNASREKSLNTSNQNFTAPTDISIKSAQSSLIKYLAKNGTKIDPKILSKSFNSSTDASLKASAAATTYNRTYDDVMKDRLNHYSIDLKKAYASNKGKKGRVLLNSDYRQAQLLLKQLNRQ
ncbi:MAG: hypothetical protein NVS1B10_04420 [Candidatus Saccharimonadales bacterium]